MNENQPDVREYRAKVAAAEAEFGTDHPEVAQALLKFAMVCDDDDDAADAAFLRSADIFQQHGHEMVRRPLSFMASRYRDRRDWTSAERVYRRMTELLTEDAKSAFDASDAWFELARLCRRDGRTEEAAECYEHSLCRKEQVEDERLRGSNFDLLRSLGDCYLDLGRCQDAIQMYTRCLAAVEQEKARRNIWLATAEVLQQLSFAAWHSRAKLGSAILQQYVKPLIEIMRVVLPYDYVLRHGAFSMTVAKEYENAEAMLRKALEYYAISLGTDYDEPKRLELQIAESLRLQGTLAEAEVLLDDVLLFFETKYGPRHRYVSEALEELGLVYEAQQRLDEATTAFDRIATTWDTLPPEQRQYAGPRLRQAADYFRRQGDLERAESLLQAGLANKTEGSDFDWTSTLLAGLAEVREDQTKYAEAAKLAEQSDNLISGLGGENTRLLAEWSHHVGIAYSVIDKDEQARKYLMISGAIAELDGNVPARIEAETLIHLASIDREEGDFDAALTHVRRALVLWESVDDVTDNEWEFIYSTAADVFLNEGYLAEAEEYALRVINNRRKAFGDESPHQARGQLVLAQVYRKQKKTDAALALLEQVDALLTRADEKYAETLIESLKHRAQILYRLGRDDEAAACSSRAAQLREAKS